MFCQVTSLIAAAAPAARSSPGGSPVSPIPTLSFAAAALAMSINPTITLRIRTPHPDLCRFLDPTPSPLAGEGWGGGSHDMTRRLLVRRDRAQRRRLDAAARRDARAALGERAALRRGRTRRFDRADAAVAPAAGLEPRHRL